MGQRWWPTHCFVEEAASLIGDQKSFDGPRREGFQEDFGDFTYWLDYLLCFFSFKDEAAGICGVGSISCHSSRGRSQTSGLQIPAEQICSGGARPDFTVQHLQCWLKVRRPWGFKLGPFLDS